MDLVAIPFSFRVTCNHRFWKSLLIAEMLPYPSLFGSPATRSAAHGLSILPRRCHTLLFSGHLQQRWIRMCERGGQVAYTLLFSGHLQRIELKESYYVQAGCHTLLFSGHLQLCADSFGEVAPGRLPYPSLFGSLQRKLRSKGGPRSPVAIPFSFRVTCNE